MEGLEDRRRATKNPDKRITEEERKEVIKHKKTMPSFGAERLKRDYELSINVNSIFKICREEGLIGR